MKTSQFIHSILARFATVEHTAWSCDLHVMGIDCTVDECWLTCAATSMMPHTVTHTTACVQLTVTMLKWLGNVFVGYWLRKYSALTPVDARERRK